MEYKIIKIDIKQDGTAKELYIIQEEVWLREGQNYMKRIGKTTTILEALRASQRI